MTRADNTRYLAQAAADRHQATLKKAVDAVEHLDRSGQPVTFSAIAAAAGVSRTWLYRNPAIRDLIAPPALRAITGSQHPGRPARHRRIAPHPPGRRAPGDHPPPSRERHPPRTGSSPPRPATLPRQRQPATLTPPMRITSRQLHVNDAEPLIHQGLPQVG